MICSVIPGFLISTETRRHIQQTNANQANEQTSKQANKLTNNQADKKTLTNYSNAIDKQTMKPIYPHSTQNKTKLFSNFRASKNRIHIFAGLSGWFETS